MSKVMKVEELKTKRFVIRSMEVTLILTTYQLSLDSDKR